MAKTFYYDSVDILNSTLNDGTVTYSGTEGFNDGTTLTNEERAVDQSVSTAITAWAENDALQFDLGSAKSVDFIAVYFNAAEADDIRLSYDNASSGQTAADIDSFSSCSVGWNVDEFSSQSYQYWIVSALTAGGLVGITEIILGAKLAFDMNPDIGIGEQEIYGTDIQRSIGGVEYGTKSHEPISTISMNFSSIPSSFKTSLQSMEADVQDFKKFVYSENGVSGPFHYVRLNGPISYSEVAYQRFSASFTLREQLS